MPRKKVVLASLLLDENLGEELYARSLKALLREAAAQRGMEIELVDLDLKGRERVDGKVIHVGTRRSGLVQRAILKAAGLLCGRLKRPDILRHLEWKLRARNEPRLRDYISAILPGASLLIFGGGGLIGTSYHNYYHPIELITRMAGALDVPVCFNAVGKVFDHERQFGWYLMRRAMRAGNVKSVTCRDNADWVNQAFYSGQAFATEMPCSAILCAQAYGVQRERDSNAIGIGVIRGNIFQYSEQGLSQEQMLDLYEGVVRALVDRGYECCVFTNGYIGDIRFGELLAGRLGSLPGVRYALEQRDGESLLRTIASFRAIVTARLHSVIAAYSLGVPAVALTWNEKIPDFMELIGTPKRALQPQGLSAYAVVEALEEACGEGYSDSRRAELERQVRDGVRRLLDFAK